MLEGIATIRQGHDRHDRRGRIAAVPTGLNFPMRHGGTTLSASTGEVPALQEGALYVPTLLSDVARHKTRIIGQRPAGSRPGRARPGEGWDYLMP